MVILKGNFKERGCEHIYSDVSTLTTQMTFPVIHVVTKNPMTSVLQARSPFYTLSQVKSSVSAKYPQLMWNGTEPFTPLSSKISSRWRGPSHTNVLFCHRRSSCPHPVLGAPSMVSHGHWVPIFPKALINVTSCWNAVGTVANVQEMLIDFENLLDGSHPRTLHPIHIKKK